MVQLVQFKKNLCPTYLIANIKISFCCIEKIIPWLNRLWRPEKQNTVEVVKIREEKPEQNCRYLNTMYFFKAESFRVFNYNIGIPVYYALIKSL